MLPFLGPFFRREEEHFLAIKAIDVFLSLSRCSNLFLSLENHHSWSCLELTDKIWSADIIWTPPKKRVKLLNSSDPRKIFLRSYVSGIIIIEMPPAMSEGEINPVLRLVFLTAKCEPIQKNRLLQGYKILSVRSKAAIRRKKCQRQKFETCEFEELWM